MPAVPGVSVLHAAVWMFGQEPELNNALEQLAQAYLAEVEAHRHDPDWLVATWGCPTVRLAELERAIGSDRLAWLRMLGFVSLATHRSVGAIAVIRVEELLDYHIAQLWAGNLLACSRSRISGLADELLENCNLIPNGARCLALAVQLVIERDGARGYDLVREFVEREPTVDRLGPGSKLQLLTKDHWNIQIVFGEGMDEPVVGRIEPWLALSYLASWPMGTEGAMETLNAKIFAKLGAYPNLIVQPPPALASETMQVQYPRYPGHRPRRVHELGHLRATHSSDDRLGAPVPTGATPVGRTRTRVEQLPARLADPAGRSDLPHERHPRSRASVRRDHRTARSVVRRPPAHARVDAC